MNQEKTLNNKAKKNTEKHQVLKKVLQFASEYDLFALLYVLKTKHIGVEKAANSKKLYEEVYKDMVYEAVNATNDDSFELDHSSQFRETIKRFVAIQDAGKGEAERCDEAFKEVFVLLKEKGKAGTNRLEDEEDIRTLLYNFAVLFEIIIGGTIKYITKSNSKAANPQRLYYFEPTAPESTVNLLAGMVLCNQLISLPVKSELLDMVRLLNLSFRNPLEDSPMPKRKGKNRDSIVLPEQSEAFLQNVMTIYAALRKRQKIDITYGKYTGKAADGKGRNGNASIEFIERSANMINPYALFWNKGNYYLLATNDKWDSPVHYRVDRLITVKLVNDEEGNAVPRQDIPGDLEEYFLDASGKKDKWGRVENFQTDLYVRHHPSMRIYKRKKLIDCKFDVIDWELQMLVDAFGTDLLISEKLDEQGNPVTRIDYNNQVEKVYEVAVKRVQYENALSFAITHAEYMTVTAPDYLVADVREWLQKMVDRLK